jgi:hypothetical protein
MGPWSFWPAERTKDWILRNYPEPAPDVHVFTFMDKVVNALLRHVASKVRKP